MLGTDRAVQIAVMGIAGQRLDCGEGSVAFDLETQMPADLGQLRQIDIAEFRVGVPQIAEAEGDTPGVGWQICQEPSRRSIRREQLDDGFRIETLVRPGFQPIGHKPLVLGGREQVRPGIA